MKIEYEHTPYRQEPSRGTGSHVEQREGEAFVRRTRGDHGRLVKHDYECPVHGRFEARCPSDAVPNEMPCPHADIGVDLGYTMAPRVNHCGRTSTWRAQQIAVGWSAGSVRS